MNLPFKLKITIEKSLLITILIATFFPYLKTTSFNSDIQPHVICIFIIYLVINAFLLNKFAISSANLIVLFFYTILATILESDIYDIVRIGFAFLSIFIFLRILPKYPITVCHFIEGVVLIYFSVALFQIFLGDNFLEMVIANVRTSKGRGVTSLTSEPSYFGLISLSHIILLEVFGTRHKRRFQFLALINVFFSASLAAIVPTIVCLMFYFFGDNKWSFPVIYTVLVLVLANFILYYFPDMRVAKLITIALDDPDLLITKDISFLNRITRSFGPMYLAICDGLVPHYFDTIEYDLQRISFIEVVSSEAKITRLSNIVSYFMYGFGFFSLPIFMYYLYIILKNKIPVFIIMAIIFFMLANISIATPYALFLFSLPFFYNSLNRRVDFETRVF